MKNIKIKNKQKSVLFQGVEPQSTESKSVVLPLHQKSVKGEFHPLID